MTWRSERDQVAKKQYKHIVRTDSICFCIAQYGQYDWYHLSRFMSSADKALFVDALT